jgi:hypothetical protein
MRLKALFFFLLISASLQAQMQINSYLYRPELAVEATVTTFAGTSYYWQDRTPNLSFETSVLFDSVTQRTFLSSAMPWTNFYVSMGQLFFFDAQSGYYPTTIQTTEKQSEVERHLTTALTPPLDNGKIYILQEENHNGILELWGGTIKDGFTKKQTLAGPYSRFTTYKTSPTEFVAVCQKNSDDIAVLFFDPVTETLTNEKVVLTHYLSHRLYPYKPPGAYKDPHGYFYMGFTPADNTDGYKGQRIAKTKDFITWTNIPETHSFNISSGPTTWFSLNGNNYEYVPYAAKMGDVISVLTPEGKFYGLRCDETTGDLTLNFYNDAGTVVNKAVNIPGVTVANQAVTGLLNGGACDNGWAFARNGALYFAIRIVDGSYYKFHIFKTSDEGDSWTDLGDLTPGVNEHIHRCKGPENIGNVPDNTKFPIYSCKYTFDNVSGKLTDVYSSLASFGPAPSPGPTYNTSTLTDIDDLTWTFAYESDDVVLSGSDITQLNDKSGNGRHAIAEGTPSLSSGAIITSGNEGFDLPFYTDVLNDTAFTIAMVIKMASTNFTTVLSFSDEATTTNNVYLSLNNPTLLNNALSVIKQNNASTGSNRLVVTSEAVFNSTDYAICIITGNSRHWRIFTNGKEDKKTFISPGQMSFMGNWLASMSGIDNGKIGILKRTSSTYTPIHFKALAYSNAALSFEDRQKLEKYFADKYSITLTQQIIWE